jgi:hypothetical protein
MEGKKNSYFRWIRFFVIWICYLGVNFLGKGLHSYGWFLILRMSLPAVTSVCFSSYVIKNFSIDFSQIDAKILIVIPDIVSRESF